MDLETFKKQKFTRVIFDLDDTLFDTFNLLITPATHEACAAMLAAGLNAQLEEAVATRQELLDSRERAEIFKKMTELLGVKGGKNQADVSRAGFNAFHARDIKEKIFPFPGVPDLLARLKEKYELFLVTLGDQKTQTKKVELLNLLPYFQKIFFVDNTREKNKKSAFTEILSQSPDVPPDAHLSIGNRIDSEIRDAKELGMKTLLIAHGEHKNLIPQSQSEIPDYQINDISELLEILK